jgi:hypothetical protein
MSFPERIPQLKKGEIPEHIYRYESCSHITNHHKSRKNEHRRSPCMSTCIRIGTRRSKLALWQAYYVQELLEKDGLDTEIVEIETKGDKILDVSIAKIGSATAPSI